MTAVVKLFPKLLFLILGAAGADRLREGPVGRIRSGRRGSEDDQGLEPVPL